MKIRYEKHSQIDKFKWDKCVSMAYNGIIYAYSWYLDIVSPEWDALIEGDYDKIFPLTWRKKSGIFYLYQPAFTQQLGVFSTTLLTVEDTDTFLRLIPIKFRYAEINLNTFNKTEGLKYSFIPQVTFELDLIPSFENLYQNFSENLKRNIKKSGRNNISIRSDISPDEVIQLFKEGKGKSVKNYNDDDYNKLKSIIKFCTASKIGIVLGAYDTSGMLIAGAFFIASHSKVIFIFSGTHEKARNSGALHSLINYFIQQNAQRNLTLDFEGSNDKNLARFYQSFGAAECRFNMYKKNDLPWIVSKGVKFVKKIRKIADS